MAKLITFNAPALDKGKKLITIECKGYAILLPLGDRREKFVLQLNSLGKAEFLTHYASGYKLGALNPVKIRYMATRGNYARLTDRQAAVMLLADAIARNGLEKVRKIIDDAPVINPAKGG